MSLIGLQSAGGRAQVETRGGTMVSWKPEGFGEVLAMARGADIGRMDVEVHGGIPVCWPWAVREGAPGCRVHGLARYKEWSVLSRSDDVVVLSLDDDEASRSEWPYRFHLELTYRLTGGLSVEFLVMNTDFRPFACTELFHPYFRVGEARRCSVDGIDGARYFWRKEAEEGERRIWHGDFDCAQFVQGVPGYVFEETGCCHALTDPTLGRKLGITFSGNSKLVIWGAGGDSALFGNPDDPAFGDRFLCVEGGSLYRNCAYTLSPGASHKLEMMVEICGTKSIG